MIRSFDDIDKNEMRGMVRRVDSLGRILVPMEFRKELGLEKDVKIEIEVLRDGMLIQAAQHAAGNASQVAARRIDNLGRVNIPVAARRALGITYHDELEMFLLRSGMFIRKKVA